jgi:hypothetical protein
VRPLELRLTEVAPDRFLDIVPIDGEICLKLFRTILKALGIVIRNAPLPEVRGQAGVQVFRTIEIVIDAATSPSRKQVMPRCT